MIQKLKESKPVIGLVWLLVLLVAGYVIRTYLIGTNFIGNADDLLYIISDTSAFSMEDALPTLFWLPAVCYAIMYLLYVNAQHGVALNICVAAALRRGVVDETEAGRLGLASSNLQQGFTLSGLGALAEASLTCDRVVQF